MSKYLPSDTPFDTEIAWELGTAFTVRKKVSLSDSFILFNSWEILH